MISCIVMTFSNVHILFLILYLPSFPLISAEMRLRALHREHKFLFRSMTIVRPGLVCFSRISGSANRSDWFSRFLVGALQIGGILMSDDCHTINVTPLDSATDFFAAVLASRCELFGGEPVVFGGESKERSLTKDNALTLHLPITMSMVTNVFMERFIESSLANGRRLRKVEVNEWRKILSDLPSKNAISPFNDGRFDSGLGSIFGHPYEKTLKWCKSVGVADTMSSSAGPYSDDEVDKLVSFLMTHEDSLRKRMMLRTLSHFTDS